MTKWIGGVPVLAGAVWIWQQIGYLWIEEPLVESKRKSDIFAPTVPKYRRTQRAKPRTLREWSARYDSRKRA